MKSLCALLLCLSGLVFAKGPPNLVVIMVDDLGWGDLGCFGGEAKTPHLDRLAAEGRRYEQFYVASPICSPSRVAFLTGQYPARWRITSYLARRVENEARGLADHLDPAAPTLARALRGVGYANGHFGKWHLGGQRDIADAPLITAYGFDESLTNFEGLGPRLLPLTYAPGQLEPRAHALLSDTVGPGPTVWMDRATITAGYARAARTFLERAEKAGRPAYVNLWPDDPHGPHFPPLDRWGDGSPAARYRGVLEAMDAQLGEFLQALRDHVRLRDNTLVVFFSDNGPTPAVGSAGPFRGTKGMLYEGGLRSPLIVWGPGLLAPGTAGTTDRTSVFSTLDLNATLHTFAGAPAPGVELDGEVLLDTLLGRNPVSRSAPLFFRRPPDRNQFGGQKELPDLAVRHGRWKLLCEYDGTAPELYDVTSDPGERLNVAPTWPEETARLVRLVTAWHRALPADRGASLRRNVSGGAGSPGPGQGSRQPQRQAQP